MAGADWLAAEVAALGAEAAIEKFALDRLDPIAAFLEIDGARIEAVPVFDAPATDAAGIWAGSGRSAATPTSPSPNCHRKPSIAANSSGCAASRRHRGFVVVCDGESPGLAPAECRKFPRDLMVRRRSTFRARRATACSPRRRRAPGPARRREPPHPGHRSQRGHLARAATVRQRGAARRDDAAQLMVAIDRRARRRHRLLARDTARAVRRRRRARPVIFTANSGHELGHLGLDDFVARRPGLGSAGIRWRRHLAALRRQYRRRRRSAVGLLAR